MNRTLEFARALLGQSTAWPASQAAGFLLFGLVLALWSWSLHRRIIFPALRRGLRLTAWLIFLWIALRGAQFLSAYSVALAQAHWDAYKARQVMLLRTSWETSWLVFAMLPSLGLQVIWHSLHPFTARSSSLPTLHGALSASLWAARYLPALRPYAGRALSVWIALSALSFAAGLLYCAASLPVRRKAAVPLALTALLAVYCDLFFRVRPAWIGQSNFVFTSSLLVFALLESCLRSGLLPCNSLHEELFARSPIRMQIIDREGGAVWSSAPAAPCQEGLIRTAPVAGGAVRWEEDLSELRAMQSRLKEASAELEKGNRLLARQNQIRGRLLSLRWQNRLCAEVEAQMRDRIEAARRLFATIPALAASGREAEARLALSQLGVLICAVKRKSHLFLKGRQDALIPLAELTLAVQESFRCARAAGIDGTFTCPRTGNVPVETALTAYDLCEQALESCLYSPPASLLTRLSLNGSRLELRALIDCSPSPDDAALLPPPLQNAVEKMGGSCRVERDEDGVHFSCALPAASNERREQP